MDTYKVNFAGNKKIDVFYNGFEINTDQLKVNGGEETAPEPFALFLSSIAACAGIYAKSFCDIRKISTENMTMTLTPEFKENQKLMAGIYIVLSVDQSFPEKYIKAIIKTMNSCAVKNQINPDIPVDTQVVYLKA